MAQTYTNEAYVARRRKVGTYTNLGGLAVLVLGFMASLNPASELVIPTGGEPFRLAYIWLAYVALILGFGLSTYGSRFLLYARIEPERRLNMAVKGLDKSYRLYNYALLAPHVLLTPWALVVLHIKPQDGAITYKGGRWSQPFSLLRLIRFFAIEPLGQPDKELERWQGKLSEWSKSKAPDLSVPVQGYVVFVNPTARVQLEGEPGSVVLLSQNEDALKEALRRDRGAPLPSSVYGRLAGLLKEESHAQAAD